MKYGVLHCLRWPARYVLLCSCSRLIHFDIIIAILLSRLGLDSERILLTRDLYNHGHQNMTTHSHAGLEWVETGKWKHGHGHGTC